MRSVFKIFGSERVQVKSPRRTTDARCLKLTSEPC